MKKVVFCLLALLAACSQPKVIPDEQLAMIFRDAFLTNAYMGRTRVNADSLKVYEPIFKRYGYTSSDVQYTIANFSKRKSARLSDVVETAIQLLDDEGSRYTHEVAVLDTIDHASRRALSRVVYADSLIRVRRLRDTGQLKVTVPDVVPGDYTVSMRYLVDSLDENSTLRGGVWFDREGRTPRNNRTYVLRRNYEERFERSLTADSADRSLVFDFAGMSRPPKRPSITIRDLKIVYTPPTALAVDSFYRRQMDIRIFAEDFFYRAGQKDSL